MIRRTEIAALIAHPEIGKTYQLMGWVKSFRANRFIALNDGSTMNHFQVVLDLDIIKEEELKKISFHSCIQVTGALAKSQGSGQDFELIATAVTILGDNAPDQYPLQPKRQTMEFLRQKAHLRMRTNTFNAIFRIRHGVAFAVHQYFNDKGFFYLHSPIITGSDAEGAGEMFRVSTLDPQHPPLTESGSVDFSKDFFEHPTNLTVSGQLQAEIGALSMGKVYTFGPTFRAENSNTPRHLAEFWMIEPEMAFYDIDDNMELAEEFCKYLIRYILDHYPDELAFLDARLKEEEKSLPQDKRRALSLIEQLKFVADNDFEKITYTEAIKILQASKPYKKKKFEFPVEWGKDLQAEHERYLVEKHFQKPVIVKDYPKAIKAFYMRLNPNDTEVPGETVAAMDVLFPGIGEVIGGSQREERLELLKGRMKEANIPEEELWWYLELRQFGTAPHSGFGLGFERMVQFITGMSNIRDVIPFPRTPGNAAF